MDASLLGFNFAGMQVASLVSDHAMLVNTSCARGDQTKQRLACHLISINKERNKYPDIDKSLPFCGISVKVHNKRSGSA